MTHRCQSSSPVTAFVAVEGTYKARQLTQQAMVVRVGYLGPAGTYSHEAAIQQFPSDSYKDVEFIPQKSIGACFTSVQDGSIDYAMVPLENSTNGQVVFTYDFFRDWFMNKEYEEPNFKVVAEQFVSIHHNLITFADDVKDITRIYSHPQVWTQCWAFLQSHELDNGLRVEKMDTSSTSRAVELVSQLAPDDPLRRCTAAIASKTASEVHSVPIKVSHVEDDAANTTRFLCISSKDIEYAGNGKAESNSSSKMHLLAFALKNTDNTRQGALCDVLERFRENGLNLQSITTRPAKSGRPWEYVFFVETWDGSLGAVDQCVQEISTIVDNVQLMGTFIRE
jgi:prephenate dehydratase